MSRSSATFERKRDGSDDGQSAQQQRVRLNATRLQGSTRMTSSTPLPHTASAAPNASATAGSVAASQHPMMMIRENSVSELRTSPAASTRRVSLDDKDFDAIGIAAGAAAGTSAGVSPANRHLGSAGKRSPKTWADESFSDWTVICGEKSYRLHKMALGRGPRRSEFFLRLFTTALHGIESQTACTDLSLALPQRCQEIWEQVLDYIYDGFFAPTADTAIPLLRMSQFLAIEELTKQLNGWITKSLSRDNALVYLMDSMELKQDEIIPQAIATVARHFQSYPPGQLVDLPPDIFRAITNMDKINISSENDIFNAVKKYVESRELTERQVEELYSSCRFAQMTADALLEASRTPGIPRRLLMDGMVARLLRQEKTAAEFDLFAKSQEEPWRLEQRAGVFRKFVYQHDFDQNGLLHWIGTRDGAQAWANPAKLGLVKLTSSQVDRGQISDILEEKNTSFFLNPSGNSAWFALDLGTHHIIPTHYTLRHSAVNPAEHFIRNWKFQGSNDGIKWVTLVSHKRDCTIDAQHLTATFAVPQEGPTHMQSFTHLKITSTGNNSSNRGYFLVSGFEVYGILLDAPLPAFPPNYAAAGTSAAAVVSSPSSQLNSSDSAGGSSASANASGGLSPNVSAPLFSAALSPSAAGNSSIGSPAARSPSMLQSPTNAPAANSSPIPPSSLRSSPVQFQTPQLQATPQSVSQQTRMRSPASLPEFVSRAPLDREFSS